MWTLRTESPLTTLNGSCFLLRLQADGANENSDNLGLIKAVLVAGLYPNVVKVEMPKGKGGGKGGKKPARPQPPKLTTRKLWEANAKEEQASRVGRCWMGPARCLALYRAAVPSLGLCCDFAALSLWSSPPLPRAATSVLSFSFSAFRIISPPPSRFYIDPGLPLLC